MSNRQLTPEQQKSKREDEIACRISMAFAGLVVIWQIVSVLVK